MASPKKYLDSEPGYVHSLTGVQESKRTKRLWYQLELQTSPTKYKRVAGFDRKSHEKLLHHQSTGSPVKIVNVSQQDGGDLLIGNSSSIIDVNPADVRFESKQSDLPSKKFVPANAIDISLNQLTQLTRNQSVNVEAFLTLGDEAPKEVTKRNLNKGLVKEDCILEDATGNATIHIWDEMLDIVKDSTTYRIKNLSVKNFSGSTLLGTTINTTFTEIETQIKDPKGKAILASLEKTITIEEFKMIDKVNVFIVCQVKSCSKKIPFMAGRKVSTCPACNTAQKIKASTTAASARLCAEVNGKDVWFTAMDKPIDTLLEKIGMTKECDTQAIKEALCEIEGVTLKYNTKSNFIISIE